MKALNNYLRRLHNRIKENKGTFILYTILRLMVLAALIRSRGPCRIVKAHLRFRFSEFIAMLSDKLRMSHSLLD